MWWLVFTAVDLYLGLILIDVLTKSDSIPPHKLRAMRITKKVMIGGLCVTAVMFAARFWR